jgi:hypothetical protein
LRINFVFRKIKKSTFVSTLVGRNWAVLFIFRKICANNLKNAVLIILGIN